MAQSKPARPNTMFDGVPSVYWELKHNGREMVKEHIKLMKWIDKLLKKKSKQFQYWDGTRMHKRPQTAEHGFFKVIMRSSPEYLMPGKAQEDLVLLFSLKDLYLLGFLHNNKWYFFKDAKLEGTGHDEEKHSDDWERLRVDGGHSAKVFQNTPMGVMALAKAHATLINHLNRNIREVKRSLIIIVIAICEAKRFQEWRKCLLEIFGRVNDDKVTGWYFMNMFQNWSGTCKMLLKDPELYEPVLEQHPTYLSALHAVSVVLVSEKTKPAPPAEAEFGNPFDQYDSDYYLERPAYDLVAPVYVAGPN